MKAKNTQNNDGESRFERLHPASAAACRKIAAFLEAVKREVFEEYQAALGANEQLLRLAIMEADALARQTEYPHLVLPLLAAEKAGNAARWQFRQQFLLRSNDALSA